MKKHLVVATGNKNKMREIREILKDLDVEILSMEEAGVCAAPFIFGREIPACAILIILHFLISLFSRWQHHSACT